MDLRELECFLALAEELHFGRAGERLYVSQSRVSQLLRRLEGRVGARLVDRTSRRVALTPLGERFLARLRPAYAALGAAVEDARDAARGIRGVLRVGFQGTADAYVTGAVRTFRNSHPDCAIELVELPLSDPFGALRRGGCDAAIVLLPVREPDLVLGPVFSRRPQTLAVSVRHPFARRASLPAEDLADCPLVTVAGPAPAYWREAQSPSSTPAGRPIPPGPAVTTLQEGLTLTATGRAAMLLCRPTADYHGRHDIAHLPVSGLPPSALALTWPRNTETARLRAFADVLAEAAKDT
ncbi:LysR family transcriptional regulator [Streptomyces caatingaensis]|uniref:LysR family transcriptional regulator n=1 Tax=Streptomyces caatingaensis TaxID=1678637 RepID=UPI00069D92BE|nr:LysR family transcriptional regulator [Streptomyces caatingaensis]